MSEIINLHVTVFGRVQGVGYRAFVFRTAQSYGVSGFVKNQIDGTVFIEVEGQQHQVSTFLAKCKSGPGWSHDDSLETEEFPVRGFSEFRIKY